MRIEYLLIGVVLIGAMAAGIGTVLIDMDSTYGVSTDTSFVQTFNKVDELKNRSMSMSDKLYGKEVTEGDQATDSISFLTGTISTFRKVWKSIGTVKILVQDSTTYLDIPPEWTAAFVTILAIAFVFTALGIYFKMKV